MLMLATSSTPSTLYIRFQVPTLLQRPPIHSFAAEAKRYLPSPPITSLTYLPYPSSGRIYNANDPVATRPRPTNMAIGRSMYCNLTKLSDIEPQFRPCNKIRELDKQKELCSKAKVAYLTALPQLCLVLVSRKL